MQKTIVYLLTALLLVSVIACKDKKGNWDSEKEVETKVKSDKNDFLVTIQTDMGEMHAILYPQTPQHRENFVKLARQGFFDGLLFHRVIKGFMIQGGDPESRDAESGSSLGNGDIGYLLPAEITPELRHVKGALAAARKGNNVNPEKESSACQFYITDGNVLSEAELEGVLVNQHKLSECFNKLLQMEKYADLQSKVAYMQMEQDRKGYYKLMMDSKELCEEEFGVELDKPLDPKTKAAYTSIGGAPELDGEYTVFGQVIDGLEVIDKIAAARTNRANRPISNIKMEVKVEELPKSEIEERYGYHY
ncbi:peptidylprolyl isomerase [Limibacter armeniacum]|uniref:peptidylprolyl isomerase n=1 Tax=Limibacter armeniacum TaxID=466084 RepID=UPI002FE58C50